MRAARTLGRAHRMKWNHTPAAADLARWGPGGPRVCARVRSAFERKARQVRAVVVGYPRLSSTAGYGSPASAARRWRAVGGGQASVRRFIESLDPGVGARWPDCRGRAGRRRQLEISVRTRWLNAVNCCVGTIRRFSQVSCFFLWLVHLPYLSTQRAPTQPQTHDGPGS